MASIEKQAQRVNLWSALIQRTWATAGALGIQGWLSGGASAIVIAAWGLIVWLYGQLPWWILIFAALLLGIATLRFYVEIRRAWAVKGLKTLNLVEIGKDCQKFREDVLEFLVSRVDTAPGRRTEIPMLRDPQNVANLMHEAWAQGVDYSTRTRARAAQKFAHRAVALCHVMANAGITPPDLWGFDHDLAGIAAYIGAIGELLEKGLLKEARELKPTDTGRMHIYLG